MIAVSPVPISWLTLALAGVGLSFLGVLLGFFLAGRLKKTPLERSDTYRLRVETQKRWLESAERANQGLQQAMEVLEWAAGTDRLTGAWNRRRFEEAATAEMALVRRRKGPVSLMMLDLDFFKNVNEFFVSYRVLWLSRVGLQFEEGNLVLSSLHVSKDSSRSRRTGLRVVDDFITF